MSDRGQSTATPWAIIGIAVVLAVGGMVVGGMYQPGPWWLWANDACPDVNTFCGTPALGPFLIIGLASLVAVVGVTWARRSETEVAD